MRLGGRHPRPSPSLCLLCSISCKWVSCRIYLFFLSCARAPVVGYLLSTIFPINVRCCFASICSASGPWSLCLQPESREPPASLDGWIPPGWLGLTSAQVAVWPAEALLTDGPNRRVLNILANFIGWRVFFWLPDIGSHQYPKICQSSLWFNCIFCLPGNVFSF